MITIGRLVARGVPAVQRSGRWRHLLAAIRVLRAAPVQDTDQGVVHRPLQFGAGKDPFVLENQHRRLAPAQVAQIDVAPLAHHVPEENRALEGVHRIGEGILNPAEGGCCMGRAPVGRLGVAWFSLVRCG
jgi:hypothetical protein